MLWINKSVHTLKFKMDISDGKGMNLIIVLPDEIVDLRNVSKDSVRMMAPQLVPYEKPIEEPIAEVIEVEEIIPKRKRGRQKK